MYILHAVLTNALLNRIDRTIQFSCIQFSLFSIPAILPAMWASTTIPILALLPSLVSAHGRIVNITTSTGTVYNGWDPELALSAQPNSLLPIAAWSASNLGNIYVPPSSFNTSNITCHFNAEPGALHVNTTAGDTLRLQWNEWPVSHSGPVLTYLAACEGGNCADADKNKLKWVKIDEVGWLNSTNWEIGLGGTWASNVLISQDFSWTVKVPDGLAEGGYVLRHEIIALHVANETDGAQAYPQCVNLRVKKGGEMQIDGGVLGQELYHEDDKGILVDIHGKLDGYVIPGPRVWGGATGFRQPGEKR